MSSNLVDSDLEMTMHEQIETVHEIDADPARVWQIISRAAGVDEWFPMGTACQLRGVGEGAKRICSTTAGDLTETVVKIDHQTRTFQYSIDAQPLLPIDSVLATMTVAESQKQTVLYWTLRYRLQDAAQNEMVRQAIAQMYADGAAGLQKAAQTQLRN